MPVLLAASSVQSNLLHFFFMTRNGLILTWLLIINLITFLVYGFDKLKAKRKEKHPDTSRVPEKTLFLLAIIGGSIGALLGMSVWHHKTAHKSFRFGIPFILFLQVAIPFALWIYFTFVR